MWLYRRKPVVHVDVNENVPSPAHPETRVATYEIAGQTQSSFYFTPKSFWYSAILVNHVKDSLTGTLPGNEIKRALVKVWRADDVKTSPKFEISVARVIWALLALQVLALISLIIWGLLIPQETVEQYFPGAALAAVTANAAFFFGQLTVRISKLGDPFEYTTKRTILAGISTVVGILLNSSVLVIFVFPGILPAVIIQHAEDLKRFMGIAGLVLTIIGAGISGAFDTFKWAIVEEVQRRSKHARDVIDIIERRNSV